MPKFAINELLHELGTTEQKIHRGGLSFGSSLKDVPGMSFAKSPKPSPRWLGSGWDPNTSHADADALGL